MFPGVSRHFPAAALSVVICCCCNSADWRFNTPSRQRGSFHVYRFLSFGLTISVSSDLTEEFFGFFRPLLAGCFLFVNRKMVIRETPHEHLSRWALWKHLQPVYSLLTTQRGDKCINVNSQKGTRACVRGFDHGPQLNNRRGGQQGAAWIKIHREIKRNARDMNKAFGTVSVKDTTTLNAWANHTGQSFIFKSPAFWAWITGAIVGTCQETGFRGSALGKMKRNKDVMCTNLDSSELLGSFVLYFRDKRRLWSFFGTDGATTLWIVSECILGWLQAAGENRLTKHRHPSRRQPSQ